MKRQARQLLQERLGDRPTERIHGVYRKIVSPVTLIRSIVDPDLKRSGEQLRALRSQYAGQRCFVIGNGPSLNELDLSLLSGEHTFGLNRIYLAFERLGFSTEFLVVANKFVIEQTADELVQAPSKKFLNWGSRSHVDKSDDIIWMQVDQVDHFSKRPDLLGVRTSATVTCVALQLAYYMGFSEVVLIGVDHSFKSQGPAHKVVTSTGDDPNHFDPNYFGPGFKWQLPDLVQSEIGYRQMKELFESSGRTIKDATKGGKLTVFPKANYDSLF